jgi:hypothetical protein
MSTPSNNLPLSASLMPPSCFDRADGNRFTGLPGTPTPDGAIRYNIAGKGFKDLNDLRSGDGSFFEEYPDSPEIERAEQATITHRFVCDPINGFVLITSTSRGQINLDLEGNYTRILSAKLNFRRGNYCDFTTISEGISFDTPPDEFSCETVELNPGLDKHPRYALLTYHERALIKQRINTDDLDLQTSIINALSTVFTGSNLSHLYPAQELLNKYDYGIDSFYLPGLKIQWSQYFWAPQFINPGGFIQDPVTSNNLPSYFWDTNTTAGHTPNFSDSIFANMVIENPNIYTGGISWLRQEDTLTLQRTWWRLTRTWLGGPLGHWDPELYTVTLDGTKTDKKPANALPYATGSNGGGYTF